VAFCSQKTEVENVRMLTLLLHDERFSGWKVESKLTRPHFSLKYMSFCRKKGWNPLLYTFHQDAKEKQVYKLDGVGTVKVFPVKNRFPPFQVFGNDHNPRAILQEILADQPELVHFHHYYLFSYPYTALWLKAKFRRPLVAQLHGYNNGSLRKWLYLPCLLALRKADKILFSYAPEERLYRKIGVSSKAVKIPVPGVDVEVFRRQKRLDSQRLLYVGRVPRIEMAHGEKSPFLLLHILRRLRVLVKDAALDVVGDGPGLARCVQLSKDLGLEGHVAFHGYVPHDDLPKYYEASGLAVAPIRVHDVDGWFDGMIQESLSCGTPVAAFKTSVSHPSRGTYGFLLSNDAEKAAVEIAALLRNPEEMEQAAEEGSKFVHENCSDAVVADRLREIWEGLARA